MGEYTCLITPDLTSERGENSSANSIKPKHEDCLKPKATEESIDYNDMYAQAYIKIIDVDMAKFSEVTEIWKEILFIVNFALYSTYILGIFFYKHFTLPPYFFK